MGRFMVQIFGARREPWIPGAIQDGDQTEISDLDLDNQQTIVALPPPEAVRATTSPGAGVAEWRSESSLQRPPMRRPPPPTAEVALPRTMTPVGPPQSFMGLDDVSQVGAQPLIDEKLGWETSPGNRLIEPPQPGFATRVPTRVGDPQYGPNRKWLVLAIVLVVLTGALVVVIASGLVPF
jgi:hypothetical protein